MPGIALTAQRIRFAVDASKPFAGSVNDAITGSQISLPSGSALNFELLFYFANLADGSLLDLTQYSEIVVALCANSDPHAGTIYYQGAVQAANFNTGATVEEWNGGTAASAHLQLFVPSAQNVVPAGNTNFWIVVYGVSTDAAQDSVLLFATNIRGLDSGVPAVNPGTQIPLSWGSYIPFYCSDGNTRNFSLVKAPNGQWTYQIGAAYVGPGVASVPIKCADNVVRNVSLTQDSGNWTIAIAD